MKAIIYFLMFSYRYQQLNIPTWELSYRLFIYKMSKIFTQPSIWYEYYNIMYIVYTSGTNRIFHLPIGSCIQLYKL